MTVSSKNSLAPFYSASENWLKFIAESTLYQYLKLKCMISTLYTLKPYPFSYSRFPNQVINKETKKKLYNNHTCSLIPIVHNFHVKSFIQPENNCL